jgi:hypothetical protein
MQDAFGVERSEVSKATNARTMLALSRVASRAKSGSPAARYANARMEGKLLGNAGRVNGRPVQTLNGNTIPQSQRGFLPTDAEIAGNVRRGLGRAL